MLNILHISNIKQTILDLFISSPVLGMGKVRIINHFAPISKAVHSNMLSMYCFKLRGDYLKEIKRPYPYTDNRTFQQINLLLKYLYEKSDMSQEMIVNIMIGVQNNALTQIFFQDFEMSKESMYIILSHSISLLKTSDSKKAIFSSAPSIFASYSFNSSVIYRSAFTSVCFRIHSSGTLSLCVFLTSI